MSALGFVFDIVKIKLAEPPSLIFEEETPRAMAGAGVGRPLAKATTDPAALGPSAGFMRVVWHETIRFKATNANATLANSNGS